MSVQYTNTSGRVYGMSAPRPVIDIPKGFELAGIQMNPDDETKLWLWDSATQTMEIWSAEWTDVLKPLARIRRDK